VQSLLVELHDNRLLILDKATYASGYNAQTGEYGDLTSQGVIDPNEGDGGRATQEGSSPCTDGWWRHGRDGLLSATFTRTPNGPP
jgi:hypothetical protein